MTTRSTKDFNCVLVWYYDAGQKKKFRIIVAVPTESAHYLIEGYAPRNPHLAFLLNFLSCCPFFVSFFTHQHLAS